MNSPMSLRPNAHAARIIRSEARATSRMIRASRRVLGLALVLATAALASSRSAKVLWLLLVPAALAAASPPLLRWRRAPLLIEWAARVLVTGAFAISFVWGAYPVLSESMSFAIALSIGAGLVLLASAAFALAPVSGPIRPAFLPAMLGVLALAMLDPSERFLREPLALAALACIGVHLWLAERPQGGPLRLGPLALGLLATGAIAYGIVLLLLWAQPRVEAAAAGLLMPRGETGFAGASSSARLGEIEEVALSKRVVAWVATETPQRLRVRVFTRFDGAVWYPEPASTSLDLLPVPAVDAPLADWAARIPGPALAAGSAAGVGRPGDVRTRVIPAISEAETILTPAGPLLMVAPLKEARLSGLGLLTPAPPMALDIYGIVNRPGGAATAEPPSPALVEVPSETASPLAGLVARLSEGAPADEERVRRTLAFLARDFRYSLRVGRFSSRQPVVEFLLEKKRGYCEYFASAAAVLLRMQGVPVRYVSGFNVRDDSLAAGSYVVREADAHAWIEPWLPGQGWVEFDPTPSAQYSEVHAERRTPVLVAWLERLRGLLAEARACLRGGDWRAAWLWLRPGLAVLLAFGALALLVSGLRRLLRRGRHEREGVAAAESLPPELATLLAALDGAWAGCGQRRPASRGLREHLEALPEGALDAPLRAASLEAVEALYGARFGGRPASAAEVADLRRRLGPARRPA
jgi:transglutaminase-like putative cysteine protease